MPLFRSWLKLHHAVEIAESRYRPRPISSDVVLFTLGRLDNQAGWLELLKERLAVVPVVASVLPDTSYRPHLTDEPYVAELARALESYLRPSTPPSNGTPMSDLVEATNDPAALTPST